MQKGKRQRPLTEEEIEKRRYNQRLVAAIEVIMNRCPQEWEVVLEDIESQCNQRKVQDETPDNIAARWAYAHSQINKILLRLLLQASSLQPENLKTPN